MVEEGHLEEGHLHDKASLTKTLYRNVAFLDPPKQTCAAAIRELQGHGVTVKVVTGDNEHVARKVCKDVGLAVDVVLRVIDEGVLEGRKVFANISKYVRMSASSNFGNTFSVLGASIFVPFLPMLPIQILSNNLRYDIGPCSSIFDYTTYFVMLYGFGCWDVSTASGAAHSASLFQTGWFVESLITRS
jgi:magnesium-transporting ATPase (P-type)